MPCMYTYTGINYRIREAKKDGDKVVDVDGSYLIKKRQQLQDSGVSTAPLDLPSVPLSGWEVVSEENYRDAAEKYARYLNQLLCKITHNGYTFFSSI